MFSTRILVRLLMCVAGNVISVRIVLGTWKLRCSEDDLKSLKFLFILQWEPEAGCARTAMHCERENSLQNIYFTKMYESLQNYELSIKSEWPYNFRVPRTVVHSGMDAEAAQRDRRLRTPCSKVRPPSQHVHWQTFLFLFFLASSSAQGAFFLSARCVSALV